MKILNFGSLNMDYVYRVKNIVTPGETIKANCLELFPGGKGLNQSIALAHAGMEIYHAGMVGGDGEMLINVLKESRVSTEYVKKLVDKRTGNAVIQVDGEGQNSIILCEGTNGMISQSYADEVFDSFSKEDVLLLQNEINGLSYMIEKAKQKGMYIVLNPSPCNDKIKRDDLNKVNMILINEVEGMQLTGKKESREILNVINTLFPSLEIVLTMGKEGAYYMGGDRLYFKDAYHVDSVDTTAAGDTFTGFFLAGYFKTGNAEEALKTASAAAAISVTKEGASASIPDRQAVIKFMEFREHGDFS